MTKTQKKSAYLDYILCDILPHIEGITFKAMFGGYGLYHRGVIFGIIVEEDLYFKVDETNKADYEAQGSTPFTYETHNGTKGVMSYWRVPIDILEDQNHIKQWLKISVEISKKIQIKKNKKAFLKSLKAIIITLVLSRSVATSALEQYPYLDHKTSLSFAQTYVGLDAYTTGFNGKFADHDYSVTTLPRLSIGGLHFWGKTDFFVAFPLSDATQSKAENKVTQTPGFETGFKVYPWSRLDLNKISPYIGMSWLIRSFQMDTPSGQGPDIIRHDFPLLAGISYPTKLGIFELGGMLFLSNDMTYPTPRTDSTDIRLPNYAITMAYKYAIDTTDHPSIADLDALGNGAMISAGSSSAWAIDKSSYNHNHRGFLKESSTPVVFPEFGIGYHFFNQDAYINLSYRDIKVDYSAYQLEQTHHRESLTLEGAKYLCNYHGFKPYMGAGISLEHRSFKETDNGTQVQNQSDSVIKPSLLVGWDISPTPHPSILLRTNLRLILDNQLSVGNDKISFNQMEFNFVQVVVYLDRLNRSLR